MSLIKVIVKDSYTTTREGISKKTGQPYKMIQQENILFEIDDERRKVAVTLPDNVKPFQAGTYTLDPLSLLRFGQYGLEVDGFKPLQLVPVATSGMSSINKVA